MRRLVETWIAAERESHGNNLTAALKVLNETLEMQITHSRVSEWRRGKYAPSQGAISFMLCRALPAALDRCGIKVTAVQYQQLEELLWEPTGEGGERSLELL
jgi:hypothetical protein